MDRIRTAFGNGPGTGPSPGPALSLTGPLTLLGVLALLLFALAWRAQPAPAATEDDYVPPPAVAAQAERLVETVRTSLPAPAEVRDQALIAARDRARDAGNWPRSIAFQQQIVQRAAEGEATAAAFLALSELHLAGGNANAAAAAALAALQAADTATAQAQALEALSNALADQRRWQEAAQALRAALAAGADPELLQDRLDWLESMYLLRVNTVQVFADQSIPEACIRFNRPLAQPLPLPAGDYLALSPETRVSVTASSTSLCIAGLEHGRSYRAVLRKGLPQATGEALAADADLAIDVGQRPSSVSFPTGPYVLPTSRVPAVDLRSVNVGNVALRLVRITERNLVGQLRDGLYNPLYGGQIDMIAEDTGEEVWRGSMPVDGRLNEEERIAVPLSEMMRSPEPGIYVLLATNADDPEQAELPWNDWASQWIVLSDIGLTSYQGLDGMHVVARSLKDATPRAGVELRLMSRNNQLLERAVTDAQGQALFGPGLLRGSGGNRPAVLFAEGAGGNDFTFLELTGTALELGERGVAGRPAPGAVDAYLYADRGIFRPGETLDVNLLARDDAGMALPGMPMVLTLRRPDGRTAAQRTELTDALGALRTGFVLASAAQTGEWRVEAQADPAAAPVGSLQVVVEDFVPQRMDLTLRSAAEAIRVGSPVTVQAIGEYLYGAPAADLPVKGVLTLERDPAPYPALAGYHFGLVEDPYSPERRPLADSRTDAEGQAGLTILIEDLPDAGQPLRARITVNLFDEGGRPVSRSLILPVHTPSPAIGLRPAFRAGELAEGEAAAFDLAVVDAEGAPVADAELDLTWIEEQADYFWYWEDGRLRYRQTLRDRAVEQGHVRTDAQGRARVEQRLGWGRYRLAVADRAAGAASSYRFQVGWGVTPGLPDSPDALELVLDPDPDGSAREAAAFVKAPFAGVLEIMVVNDRLRYRRTLDLPESGVHVAIPVQKDWGVGAYVLATAYRPLAEEARAQAAGAPLRGPSRAMGAAWFPIGTGARTLSVTLDPPAQARPGERVAVPLSVTGSDPAALAGGLKVAVAAVDEGVLQLTGFTSPDPADHFFGQRRLAMEIHDLYGRLIAPATGQRGEPRGGGDGFGSLAGLAVQTTRVIALHEGPVSPDAQGRAVVEFDLPEGFNGRLRLMAVAWGRSTVGAGAAALTVRDPVVSSLILPQFLAPGDEAEAMLSLDNVEGGEGSFRTEVRAEGAVAVLDGGNLERRLAAGERVRHRVTLSGAEVGTGKLSLRLTGPGGLAIEQDWEIAVRPAQPWQTLRQVVRLEGGASLTTRTAAESGMLAEGASLSLSISATPDLDVPGLLASLRAYPYQCLEQILSMAYPELEARDLTARWPGLETDPNAADAVVQAAIRSSIARQRPDGSFGLWSMGGPSEPWLTLYAMDFLTRARSAGHDLPDTVLVQGRNWMLSALQNPPEGLTPDGQAYALYVLARMAAVDSSTLRYWTEALGEQVVTPLGLAFLGSARRAAGEPIAAVPQLILAAAESGAEPRAADWRDYGSSLRDAAATLAVLAESGVAASSLAPLLTAVSDSAATRQHLSTQEEAWLLRAAAAVTAAGGPAQGLRLAVAGQEIGPLAQPFVRRLGGDAPALTLRNLGSAPVWAYQTLRGVPAASLPPAAEGLRISRRYLHLDGSEADPARVRQNDQLLVVLEGGAPPGGRHQALVVDLLPAGFEIESPASGGATALSALPFLPMLSQPLFVGVRSDRYLAAIDLEENVDSFAFAYLVRAVTPGSFVHPAPFVEDMYQPHLFARGAMGRMVVERP